MALSVGSGDDMVDELMLAGILMFSRQKYLAFYCIDITHKSIVALSFENLGMLGWCHVKQRRDDVVANNRAGTIRDIIHSRQFTHFAGLKLRLRYGPAQSR
jgi:hypothetical protein